MVVFVSGKDWEVKAAEELGDENEHGRVTSCQLLKELSRYLFLAVVSILFKENYMDNDC